ncbi:hypothetical protein KSS87_010114 [Heliosperma pusillum]|nr:hypothetical protein KSS87_010114 [Heliosperma pusillum]
MSKLEYCAGSTPDGVRKLSALSSYVGQQRQISQSSLRFLRDYGGFSRDICFRRNLGVQSRFYGSEAKFVERRPSFSEVNSKDVSYFKSILGENNVILDVDRLQSANTDWMHKYKGSSKIMLLPRSTEEVSQIMSYCSSRHLAVVPQGGNTGLVGGSVPVFDEVIVNLSSMNKILSFDKVSGILVCEAGCILENLESFVDNEGYSSIVLCLRIQFCVVYVKTPTFRLQHDIRFVMPLDLGAKGSCQIGGNVSTNAGGLRLVRYGSLHGNVLGNI